MLYSNPIIAILHADAHDLQIYALPSDIRFLHNKSRFPQNPTELTKELVSDEFRKGDAARPVVEGKYAIVKHQNHTELAYTLEIPNDPGEA